MTITQSRHEFVPHAVEALLDLIPPAMLGAVMEYWTDLFEAEDWEPRHLNAAEQLCLYAELTHGKKLSKRTEAFRNKLDNYEP